MHGISGLLSALADLEPSVPSESLSAELRAERERIGWRGDRLLEDLAALGRRAAAEGLALVPLKGSYLAPERYRDLSLRPAADIDLLARDDEFDAWSRLLLDEGYERQAESADVSVFSKRSFRSPDGFAEHPDNPRPVELHRRLRFRLLGRVHDFTGLYLGETREARSVDGIAALFPGERALALHLLVHAGPALVGRGLRLLQLHDFSVLSLDAACGELAVERLGEAAWGLSALLVRAWPGLLPEAFLSAFENAAPRSTTRRRRWLSRPGLLTGEAERSVLVLAEAGLCKTPSDLARRLVHALPEGSFLDRAYGQRGFSAFARYYADRIRG